MFWSIVLPVMIYGINAISIFSLIFFRRRDMSTTFAWLLVMIFLPVAGFVLYFFFGSTHKLEIMSKTYRMKDIEDHYMKVQDFELNAIRNDQMEFTDPVTEKYRDMIVMNSRNSGCLYTRNNKVELLVNGQEKFPRMFEEIAAAKKTIHVLYFIIKTRDQIGKDFVDLLAKKAAEGVEVKVVYDGFGWLKTFRRDFRPIEEAGGKVQRFLPSHLRTILLVNYRLHRKMVVIDGKIAYTGGINVGDDYLSLYPKMNPWRDTSVRVTGPAVQDLQLRFLEDWIFLEKQNKKLRDPLYKENIAAMNERYFPHLEGEEAQPGTAGVQIISCGPDSRYQTHKDSYIKIISSAKDYVYMQSPYFVPDETLFETMRLAAQSGVDVRLMLPGIPDKKYVYYVALSYVQDLLDAGIRVYFHKGFVHAKTFVSDDHVSSVGTTNLDIRSFKLDYEVNTLVYDTEFALTCKDQYMRDIADSREVCAEEWKQRGRWHYICESVCRFIAPLA
ncbi:cardiolipin synthase [Bacilliculturomica massiliensis]|uniref:cardiolipin synthase n=1 Tax=Bacilliculturomica massiliensis TaxID=1917867 RepID=UPI00102FA7BA|nr:cardiolipin synthase [Bacilliculturomica massiliensis]